MVRGRENLLLFSKQIGRFPYRYLLYFVEKTSLNSDRFSLHRFYTSKKIFDSVNMGEVADIAYNEAKITSLAVTGIYNLADPIYFQLIEQRDKKFADIRTYRAIEKEGIAYKVEDRYYRFTVAKDILAYSPTKKHRFLVRCMRAASYVISMVVPVLLYIAFIYSQTFLISGNSTIKGITLPIAAMLTLPFIFWAMSTLFLLCEQILLNVVYSRFEMLKWYCLRLAGARKSCFIEKKRRVQMIKNCIISVALFILGLLIHLLA